MMKKKLKKKKEKKCETILFISTRENSWKSIFTFVLARSLIVVVLFSIFSVVTDNFWVVPLYVFFHYEKIITLKHDDGRKD